MTAHRRPSTLRRRRLAAVACAVAVAINGACYAYQPVSGTQPAPNERLRLTLTSSGTTDLARFLGPRIGVVEGTLVRARSDGALDLAIDGLVTVDGARQPWTGDGTVTVPPAYLASVERSALDRPRSILAGAALAGLLVGIAATALRSTSSQGGSGPGGGSPPP